MAEIVKAAADLELLLKTHLEGFAKYDGAELLRASLAPSQPGAAGEEEIVVVTVTRPAGDGFGLSFVGPADDVAPTARQGIFVTNCRPDSVCAKAGLFKRGQRILSINGDDSRRMSKFEVAAIMKREKSLVLQLQVDLVGFACYDDGKAFKRHSMRRQSAQARQSVTAREEIHTEVASSSVKVRVEPDRTWGCNLHTTQHTHARTHTHHTHTSHTRKHTHITHTHHTHITHTHTLSLSLLHPWRA